MAAARRGVEALRNAFADDLAGPAPEWTVTPAVAGAERHVLVVEDDPDQCALVTAALRQAGYRVSSVARGDDAIRATRDMRPDLTLLDIDLPGTSGLEVCRAMRTDPDLHDMPIVFVTASATASDRVAGLTAGGDDYLTKPIDVPELLLRIGLVLRRHAPAPPRAEPALAYDAFTAAAGAVLAAGPAALALIRLPRDGQHTMTRAIADEVRRRDLLGRYDDGHVMLLMPEVTAADAAQPVEALRTAIVGGNALSAGVAAAPRGAGFGTLLEQADEALAEARYRRQAVVIHGHAPTGARTAAPTVVVAEDDPDVMRVLDARLLASGYRTWLTFDGQQALDAIGQHAPDLVLLDLMMPRLTGFDVLTAIKRQGLHKPLIVVISARGREADVTRAFELGADDYLTKPFGPQELLARLSRLLR